jgi:hypothetical protein
MTTKKITTAGDVYQFVERLKTASQQDGTPELYRQLDQAMRVGSSSLEILGAIRQAVIGNRSDIERLLGPDGRLCADQVVAFVDKAYGRC